MDAGLSLPLRRAVALDRAVTWRLALGALVLGSAVARAGAAFLRATPNYFPDEYIYGALSRSIAHGHLPMVRGHVAHFPALLQPLLTAPAWWFGSLETGYRITQAIDSVAMSTAALAVWWTARRLGVARAGAFAAAAISVAVPDLGYTAWVLAEPFAYPLFIAAIGAGMVALVRPTARAQATFLAFALLASFARIQLAVLLIAYLVSAVMLRRLRAQRLVLGGVGLAALVALAGGLGYYKKAPASFHFVSPVDLARNALILAFAAGWIIVPAALLGLVAAYRRPRSPEERAFAALTLTSAVAVLLEATFYGYGGITHERYGCYLLPLLAIGFVLHAGRGWPWQRAHALLAAGLVLVSATVPLSGWAAAGKNAHSLVLTGLLKVESLAGSPGAGALDVAGVAALLSVIGIVCAWKRQTFPIAVLAIAFCVATSAFATSFDTQNSRNVKAEFLPAGPAWVHGPATLVMSADADRTSTLEQFFWNEGLQSLALLPGAQPPDVFATTATHIAGARLAGVRGQVVLDESGAALVPTQPERLNGTWLSARTPELAATVAGRGGDGWLAPAGNVHLLRAGSLTFTVTAPAATTFKIGDHRLRLHVGAPVRVTVCALGTYAYTFSSYGFIGFRHVSAHSSFPVWGGACASGAAAVTVRPAQA